MKAKESLFLVFGLVCATSQLRAQGNFQNLNFEAANIPGGTQPGAPVPFISALPGWGGSYSNLNGIVQATQATYEGISLGGAAISIIDSNAAQYGFIPLQGRYSAFLFGGISSSGDSTYSTIAQTGLVPNGSISLLMDVNAMNGFVVTLGGQTLNMVPVEAFPSYILYGADISAFAGQTAQLSITAPPTSTPNGVLLDSIVFSSNPTPEPDTLSLLALGGVLFCSRYKRAFFRCLRRRGVCSGTALGET